jgi:hypothetical protein
VSDGPILRRRKRAKVEDELDPPAQKEESLPSRDKVAPAVVAEKISSATLPTLKINEPLKLK